MDRIVSSTTSNGCFTSITNELDGVGTGVALQVGVTNLVTRGQGDGINTGSTLKCAGFEALGSDIPVVAARPRLEKGLINSSG